MEHKIIKSYYYFKLIYRRKSKYVIKMRIFGEKFDNKNNDKCKILYNNKIFELKEYFEDIDKKNNNNDLIVLKLIFIRNIINISYIFYKCDSLVSITDNAEKDENFYLSNVPIYITNMNCIFFGCTSLNAIPDISKWNTSKVTNMSYMFYECKSLKTIPDISEWNTSKVKNMRLMFNGFIPFKSSSDFSNLNIENTKGFDAKFEGCKFLFNFPTFYVLNILKNNILFNSLTNRIKIIFYFIWILS